MVLTVPLPSTATWILVLNPPRLPVLADAGAMLVDANRRGVDHANVQCPGRSTAVVLADKLLSIRHALRPYPILASAIEAGRIGSIAVRQVAPRSTRAQDVEYAIYDLAGSLAHRTLPPRRKNLPENIPFRVGHIMSAAIYEKTFIYKHLSNHHNHIYNSVHCLICKV